MKIFLDYNSESCDTQYNEADNTMENDMNYEYLTFNYDEPSDPYDEPSDPYEGLSDSELVDMMVKAAQRISPYYAIGWLSGTIKTSLWRGGATREHLIRDIEYLKTREQEND